LARAVVTLETERIKGSNPWCLWWWSHSRDPNIGRTLEVNVLRKAQDGFWCQLQSLSCARTLDIERAGLWNLGERTLSIRKWILNHAQEWCFCHLLTSSCCFLTCTTIFRWYY
jgi:hypothetical protein